MTETYLHDPAVGWTCFHCGDTFHSQGAAAIHFGATPQADPGCLKVKRGAESSLLFSLRAAEQERDETLVRLGAARLGLDQSEEDEAVERFRAQRGILLPVGSQK